MLASFVIHLKPLQPTFVDRNTGPLVHALFLSLVSQADTELADLLHRDTPVKPFTVSALQGKFAGTGKHLVTLTENTYWFRITTLTQPVFTAFNRTLLACLACHTSLSIGDTHFQVIDVKLEPTDSNLWGGISSYPEMFDKACAKTAITLLFQSPTTFKHKGRNLPFPLPGVVFNGYLQKWNAFSPFPLDRSLLSWAEDNLAVEAHHIRTRMTAFDDFQITGFIGTCRYQAINDDADKLKALNALADLAFYCGTGAKTTMGLGQTKRIK
ncbi:MAG: CRISPR-associated endoribonuclease Cas6 [Dehalococcoidia bacterium]